MKKYFYIMSIIVVCLMMCNVSLAATSLKDITGTKYQDAVENLIEIGLVNGYPEDNTYRPSVTVTRAQMAKMMVIALGEEGKVEAASKKASTFTDIKSSHWAFGYVNVAKDLGIINGYPDGRFGPEDIVTYAEASTMALRALGYEDEVEKSTESWPNNYITYGKKLSLFDEVGNFDSGKGANRGDVALILWNMLRTGVCTAVAQNNSGLVYGEGQKMINKYKNYIYEDDAMITAVSFEDDYSEAYVTITGKEKIKVTLDDSDVLACYGRRLEVLYDTKAKDIVFINDYKKYTEKEGNVTGVVSKKIYIDDDSYTLPDKANRLLYRTESIYDAIEATLFMDGSTVKYVLASGAKNIYVGLVSIVDVLVGDDDGIKIKKLGSTSETSYALIDSDDMPTKGSVIIYYLNADDEIGILKEIVLEDAKTISTATSSKVVIENKTYEYSSNDFVVVTATSTKVSNMTFKDIVKSEDMAYVYAYAGKTYLIVYENAVEDEDEKLEALNSLKQYIKDYEYLENKEASYSQVTFARFLDAMTTARSMSTSSRLVRINEAITELKDAKSGLKIVYSSTVEGKIASYRAQIRSLVKTGETIVTNRAQYTQASYDTFYAKFVAAKNLLKETNNTQVEAKNMYDDLNAAMSSSNLIKIVNTQAHKDALARLNNAISTYGNAGPEANYTAASYSLYKKAKENAINAKNNNASISHERLDELATELKDAYNNLKSAIDTAKSELNTLILDYMVYEDNSGDYMPETYGAFKTAMNAALQARKSTSITEVNSALTALKTAKENLKEISDELDSLIIKVNAMKDAPAMSSALATTPANSKDQLDKINNIKNAARTDLNNSITSAKTAITTASGNALVSLLDVTSEAQTAIDSGDIEKIVAAYVKLNTVLTAQN